jgi:hypothetical protein
MIDVSPERCWDLSTHQLQALVYGASIITKIHDQRQKTKQNSTRIISEKYGLGKRDKSEEQDCSEIDPG